MTLTRESRRIAGILLLSIVAIESGGYYLTRIVSGAVEVTDFQLGFSRAGHPARRDPHARRLLLLLDGRRPHRAERTRRPALAGRGEPGGRGAHPRRTAAALDPDDSEGPGPRPAALTGAFDPR